MDKDKYLFLDSEQATDEKPASTVSERHRLILGRTKERVDAIDGMLNDCREAFEKKPVQDRVSYSFTREMEMRRPSISYCKGGRDEWYVISVDFRTNRPIYAMRGDLTKRI